MKKSERIIWRVEAEQKTKNYILNGIKKQIKEVVK